MAKALSTTAALGLTEQTISNASEGLHMYEYRDAWEVE
jgi:hypothetical protein